MKPATALVSLLAAVAPLASACVEAAPPVDLPAETILLGGHAAPLGAEATPPAALANQKPPSNAQIFPRQAQPFGKSYEAWAGDWWQWALAIPKDENPMLGGPCDVDQSGNVFFLAGTTGGADVRSCTIKPGKAIFFPIMNLTMLSCPEVTNESYTCDMTLSEDFLHETAAWYMEDSEKTLTLEIDGVPVGDLDEYRAHTGTFLDTSPADPDDRVFPSCTGPIGENACGVAEGSSRMAVGDGHWVMLRPLPVGEHQIRFTASVVYSFGYTFSLDVTYDIVVAP